MGRISLAGNGDHWRAVVETMTSMVIQIARYLLNGRRLLLTQAGFGFLKLLLLLLLLF